MSPLCGVRIFAGHAALRTRPDKLLAPLGLSCPDSSQISPSFGQAPALVVLEFNLGGDLPRWGSPRWRSPPADLAGFRLCIRHRSPPSHLPAGFTRRRLAGGYERAPACRAAPVLRARRSHDEALYHVVHFIGCRNPLHSWRHPGSCQLRPPRSLNAVRYAAHQRRRNDE
jgi:hypothetical protein